MSLNFSQIRTLTAELSALDCVEKSIFSVVAALAPSFFFGSSLFLEVTKTSIKSRISSNFDYIRPLTAELSALEYLKINILCCGHSSIFVFQWIFFILAGNMDNYNISDEFEFRPDPTSDCGVICP